MQPRNETYPDVTATGALPEISGHAFNRYALQVKGTGAAADAWSVTLEGSLDGENWTTIATHNATDGATVWAVDKPCAFVRGNVGSLTLGSATGITVHILTAA